LYQLGIEEQTVLWNAVPWHPSKAGNPLSNASPKEEDRKEGLAYLFRFLEIFPGRRLVAVGRTAERSLQEAGLVFEGVRHPANGGATKFREALVKLTSSPP